MSSESGRYTKYIGQETEVVLSTDAEGREWHTIGSKAFLSCKTVERLVLPPTISVVEDWAFAHMKNLKEIVMPAREIRFGRQVFLGCDGLQRVLLYSVKESADYVETDTLEDIFEIDRLWASMFRFFPQERLEHPELVTTEEGRRKWLYLYDEALELWLQKPDDDGFVPAFIGWFDVEDVDDQKHGYILQKRKDKLKLCFQRLLCTAVLQEGLETYLQRVIAGYTDLCMETFMENPTYGRDIRYYKIWQQCGGLTNPIAEKLLSNLPWEEPEIRAYLLQLLQQNCKDDFFAGLEL